MTVSNDSGPNRQAVNDSDSSTTVPADQVGSGPILASKPRVWPLFALSLVELGFASLLQGLGAIVLLLATRGEYPSLQDAAKALPTRLMEPPVFVLMLVLSSSSIAAAALLFGWVSANHCGRSVTDRLGLRLPKLSAPSMFSLLLGSIPVLLVSVGVVLLIERVLPGDESVLQLYKNITLGWAIVFIILIGVLPGFGEELFFRGFFQRRMLQRFRPSVAIGVTSLVFGLFHVTPHGIASLPSLVSGWA